MKIINDFKIEVIKSHYKTDCNLIFAVKRKNTDKVKERFKILDIEMKYINDNL